MRIIKAKLESYYLKLVIESSKRNPIAVPQSVQRYYNNLTGYEYAEAVRRFVGDKQKILLIGDGGGRDYYYLKMHGKNVVALDITKQDVIPDLIIGSAERLPFKDRCFGAVVMMEVIEHIFEDFQALREIRRTLKDDGVLVLSLPFGNDIPEYHVRVYTPKTIRRLLEYSGFRIEEFIEKGGGFTFLERVRPYVYLKHGLNLFSCLLFKKTFYHKLNALLARIDFVIGRRGSFLHRLSRHYGTFIKCSKGPFKDFKKLNIEEFSNYMT